MKKSNSKTKESIDKPLIEDISEIKHIALGEGAAVCEACGTKLREGEPVVAFAFRPADQPAFEIAHVKCTGCRHEPTEYFTLGVRELVVDGRVGTCTDQATQSSWPVLLAPRPRAVSAADTTTVQPLAGSTWVRHSITASDVLAVADRASTRKPWQRAVVRAERTDAADGGSASELDRDVDADAEPDDVADPAAQTSADSRGGAR